MEEQEKETVIPDLNTGYFNVCYWLIRGNRNVSKSKLRKQWA